MSELELGFVLNGARVSLRVAADRFLIDVLRIDLGLIGTKLGCGVGVCGACSVTVDGALLSACLLPAVQVAGTVVRTVEGLASGAELAPLQDAFIRAGGFQCGICTPGQLMAATALLAELAAPSDAQIRAWMMGNLCRCTGYDQIVDAVRRAAGAPAALPGQDAAGTGDPDGSAS
jgi:carbon-monoxide dehydrogenase small subunit